MHLGEHHRGGEESPTVEGPPGAIILGLDPVEDDDVVVELWIAISRVEVGETRRDNSDDVLFDAALASRSCVEGLALGVGEDLSDGLLVAPIDHFAGLVVGQSPGQGHALGGAERQVETTHRLRAWNPAEHLAGDRIRAVLEHSLKVLRGDGLPDRNATTVVETNESGSEKDSRRSAAFAVVANEVRLVSPLGTVANGDGFEQVLVARSDVEPSNRHHVVGAPMRHNCRIRCNKGRGYTSSARRVRQLSVATEEERENQRNEG